MMEYEVWDGSEWSEYWPEVGDKIFKLGYSDVKGFFSDHSLDDKIGIDSDNEQCYVCIGAEKGWVEILRKVEPERTGKYCETCGQRVEEED